VTLYPNTRPAESWEQCADFIELWGPHGGTVLRPVADGWGDALVVVAGFRVSAARGDRFERDDWLLRWPDPLHPGLHSPEVMTEDPTTEPCLHPTARCPGPVCAFTVPGRTFVAWHTLGATIPEGWEWSWTGEVWNTLLIVPDADRRVLVRDVCVVIHDWPRPLGGTDGD
jgi:hypothetical protein